MNKKKFIIIFSIFLSSLIIFSLITVYAGVMPSIPCRLMPCRDYLLFNNYSPTSTISPSHSPIPIPSLSLETIFQSDHSWINQLPQDKTLTIITTGDIIPARTVNYKMTIYNDFTHPFKKTADFLKSADITLINLESPLIKNCPITNEGMVFCGNQRFIDGLLFAVFISDFNQPEFLENKEKEKVLNDLKDRSITIQKASH